VSQPPPVQTNQFDAFAEEFENDVVSFVRIVLGVGDDVFVTLPDGSRKQVAGIWADQLELLEAYNRKDRRIAKRSGHGPGKTTSLAWIILHHATFRFRQKTVCTAPTQKQLFEALMAETVKWYNMLPPDLQVFEVKSESFTHKAAPKESFISFRTSSAESPEALAGVHEDNVLLIVDEASGIPEPIFESASGSMSGKTAITILTGNPTRRTGTFYDVFHKPAMMEMWTRLHVSGIGHPNVDPDYPKQIAAQYGESSNAYRIRVLGEFPQVDDDTVIPWELLEAALTRDVKPLLVRPIWGVDVARKGKDASALAKRQGNVLLEPTISWHGRDTMQSVGIIKVEWDKTLPSMRPSEINIDAIGIGAGVADRLRELGLPARSINVSESASMDGRFSNLRSELWWKGREFFEKKDSALNGEGWEKVQTLTSYKWQRKEGVEWKDETLAAELSWPTMDYTSSGKIVVEQKKATMKRTNEDSPNHADAWLLTLASDAITASGTDPLPTSWKEPIRREIKGVV
jgi:phage terminase large subunit